MALVASLAERRRKTAARALVEAGAIKRVRVIGDGDRFRVEVDTPGGMHLAQTSKAQPRTWRSLDSTAKWLRSLGIASAIIDVSRWQPQQRGLNL